MRNVLAAQCADEATSTCAGQSPLVDDVRQMCDHILSLVPDQYVTADVRARLQRLGALQPMNAFLRREIERMQVVISTVGQAVVGLRRFVDGQAVYDDALVETFDAVRDAKVPPAWTKVHATRYEICRVR